MVEDEASLRRLFEDELIESRERRYRFLYAESIAQMKEICDQDGDIEAIVLDLGLRNSDGLDTLGQALLLTDQKIPIIVLTGAYGGELEEKALEMGAQAYCEKTRTNQTSLLKMIRLAIAGYKPYLRLLDTIDRLREESAVIEEAESQVKGDGLKTIQGVRERLTALARTA